MKPIVLTTIGSLGDLYPYLALADGLKQRGYTPLIATSEMYRQRVESQGIDFWPVRPDIADWGDEMELYQRITDLKTGTEYVVRHLIMPHLRASVEDLSQVIPESALLITHPLTYAGPILAEKYKIPWISTALSPLTFFSKYDPPVLAPALWLRHFRRWGPHFYGFLFYLLRQSVRSWTAPVQQLRQELGLPPTQYDPLFEGQFSPHLTLAWFSPLLATPQPDWPVNTHVTGFLFYDRDKFSSETQFQVRQFLASGPPPIVFTLGSAMVRGASDFFNQSLEAILTLRKRAIFIVGAKLLDQLPEPLPANVLVLEYAPFSYLFSHAAAIVHQGGIGTLAQALRAGRPLLIVPFSHDQPDNAERAVRLGVARSLLRQKYTAKSAVRELRQLLEQPIYSEKAIEISKIIKSEEGIITTCNLIERYLTAKH
ncbi:UDP-glucuronosyltransferase [Thioploca ingrica]|uniref:UDP-glucuronosyltransferase n=1 Tax=Thioploca ingrica TaxID=40754 RepID=A0A090AGX4_9GAMM|nr:UDP-glucuronosyltransferase [Thioploca ingrica]